MNQVQELIKQYTSTELYNKAINLLSKLISIPSFSKQEDKTALYIVDFFKQEEIETKQVGNNIIAYNLHYDKNKPTILLNSHHDTVKPNSSYTIDPFNPIIKDGKLYGLGSNDAGGCLVSLIASFMHFYNYKNLKYNLVFIASAEEEISGINGIELALKNVEEIAFAIVGEPTLMNMAIAEKGLLVVDALAKGKAGHAARNEGVNALTIALNDINWINHYQFEKVSDLLGPVKMSVTSIETPNKAHNVVPDVCRFTIDIRVNELYTLDEVLGVISNHLVSELKPRSLRLKSSQISLHHPIVKQGIKMKRTYYGSPTTSDKALMNFPSLKMGPGDSARSHTADEFIYLEEIKEGIDLYIKLLTPLITE